jgi:hypothetical protein
MADERLKNIIKAIQRETILKEGRGYVLMENGRLDFKKPFYVTGVTKSGNVKLQDFSRNKKLGKVRKIGSKETLTVGSGRGTDNYYLDLF